MNETIVERVRRDLWNRQLDDQPRDQDEGGSPVVVWERITLQDFDKWLEAHDNELPKWDYESDDTGDAGRVVVHDIPSTIHAEVDCALILRLMADVGHSDFALVSTLKSASRRTLAMGRDRFEPSGSLRPANGADTMPTLVLEVAYSESTSHLRQKLLRYMHHPAIQVAIGLKIPHTDEATNQYVVLFQRNADQDIVEQQADFGPGVHLPATPLSFPLCKLYHGGHLPPALVGEEDRAIAIDLEWLSNFVESYRH